MRFKNNLQIDFKCDPIAEELEIAPMILLPFIENSFKHGKRSDGSINVAIHLKISQKKFFFWIKNSKITPLNDQKEPFSEPQKSGIGLENIKKRLAIVYKNAHQLDIRNEPGFYEVSLTLNLANV